MGKVFSKNNHKYYVNNASTVVHRFQVPNNPRMAKFKSLLQIADVASLIFHRYFSPCHFLDTYSM